MIEGLSEDEKLLVTNPRIILQVKLREVLFTTLLQRCFAQVSKKRFQFAELNFISLYQYSNILFYRLSDLSEDSNQ